MLRIPGFVFAILFAFTSTLRADLIINGSVDFETLFYLTFPPGPAPGIGLNSSGGSVGSGPTGSGTRDVDIDGDTIKDIRVNMSYALYRSGDSSIGFRSSGSDITMYFDSNAGTAYDYGFLSMSWDVTSLRSGFVITRLPNFTASSLNGDTEAYEFGIIDTTGSITASNISSYNANNYTNNTGVYTGSGNSYTGTNGEQLLPTHLGFGTNASNEGLAVNGVTFDAGATIIGDLSTASAFSMPNNSPNVSGIGQTQFTLWYGGFDLGRGTSIGSPTASFDFRGVTTLSEVVAVPEPNALALMVLGGVITISKRLRRR